jgi:hypothetical protein
VGLNVVNQRFDGGGLVQARDNRTTVPAPIHGLDCIRNHVGASRMGVVPG